MIIGKVVGNVWSTRKDESLNGLKFLVIELRRDENIIACDYIGAGVGDRVLITQGSSARKAMENEEIPIDAAVIGIIDEIEGE
ncbi:EutN/CcmL family microcompartment protein [Cetobacterium sp. 2A]|uniref:EutN/CcmL family microcompartment protein n=1 Tax=unclassified Cetobacterium TaxID=2630983 RepID=UPI00163CEDED|nr:EutN/CcmL family microcompartment protein [Cetobacterium sp. 2A]MBC2855075.1 EutN/CcmL family microcompartment protein [Cetobacterium sp. 2A]